MHKAFASTWGKSRPVYRQLSGLLICCVLASGADWLALRGDSRATGWQPDEKLLTSRTIKSLRLLWKQRPGERPGTLTDPLLLGPIATHRGIKELVFVRNSAGTVYAIDADLGTVFWSRTFEGRGSCAGDLSVRPAMAQSPAKPKGSATADDDDFSDSKKPLYILTPDGRLHALRSSTGEDVSEPVVFVPGDVHPVSLAIIDNTLYATTSSHCGSTPDRLWTMSPGSPPASQPLGTPSRFVGRTSFSWQEKEVAAELRLNGSIDLTTSDNVAIDNLSAERPSGGLATWQDGTGTRWVYAVAHDRLTAFQVRGTRDGAILSVAWDVPGSTRTGAPVIAAGLVYFLSIANSNGSSRLQLRASEALTGRELYTSGNLLASTSASGNIAIANGHVCFSAADGILYCFGLPFEL